MTDEQFNELYDDYVSAMPEYERLIGAAVSADAGKYSISELRGEKADYGLGVILDTNLFNGVKPRNWGAVLERYVYRHMAGSELTVYDEDGNTETVYLARENDRVKKDGAKNNHKVLDKLALSTGDNIRTLATVHLPEALATSGNEKNTSEHSHQWLDENGWIYRTAYLQDKKGNIYEATLNIADGRDRKILYDINNIRLIDKARAADGVVSSTSKGRDSHINSSSSEPNAAKAKNPSPGTDSNSASVSADSIRGDNENVNSLPVKGQFSISEPVDVYSSAIGYIYIGSCFKRG